MSSHRLLLTATVAIIPCLLWLAGCGTTGSAGRPAEVRPIAIDDDLLEDMGRSKAAAAPPPVRTSDVRDEVRSVFHQTVKALLDEDAEALGRLLDATVLDSGDRLENRPGKYQREAIVNRFRAAFKRDRWQQFQQQPFLEPDSLWIISHRDLQVKPPAWRYGVMPDELRLVTGEGDMVAIANIHPEAQLQLGLPQSLFFVFHKDRQGWKIRALD